MMKPLPIRYCWMVGFFVSGLSYAAPQTSTPSNTVPKTKSSGEAVATDAQDSAEVQGEPPAASDETADNGNIFKSTERERITDPNFDVKKDKADEYFRRGTLLYEGGDFASAAQAFLVAYETLPHQAVLGNIALCFDKAGKIPEAVVYYREYLSKPVGSEKNEYMAARLKEIEALVGELDITCPKEECEIRVDGIKRCEERCSVVLMPGEHRIESYVEDALMDSQLVVTQTREKNAITLKFQKDPPVVEPPLPPTPSPVIPVEKKDKPLFSPAFWGAAGATLASGAVVATFGGLVQKTKSDFDKAVKEGSEEMDQLADDGNKYKLVTNIMIGVTSAAAIATVLLAVKDLKKRKKVKPELKVTAAKAELGFGVAIPF